MFTEVEIEAEAKRWYENIANRSWDQRNGFEKALAIAHARCVLEWLYDPPPVPREITDADVLRCAEAMWVAGRHEETWHDVRRTEQSVFKAYAHACLTAFLTPPAVDPRIAIVVAQIESVCSDGNSDAQRVARDILAALDGAGGSV